MGAGWSFRRSAPHHRRRRRATKLKLSFGLLNPWVWNVMHTTIITGSRIWDNRFVLDSLRGALAYTPTHLTLNADVNFPNPSFNGYPSRRFMVHWIENKSIIDIYKSVNIEHFGFLLNDYYLFYQNFVLWNLFYICLFIRRHLSRNLIKLKII